MKLALMVAILIAGTAQQRGFYRSPEGDLKVEYNQWFISRLPDGQARLTVSGKVKASSASKGLDLSADRATLDIASVRGKSNLKRMQAKGSVVITKSPVAKKSVAEKADTSSVVINSSFADLRASAEADQVALTGPVTITQLDATKSQIVVAKGAAGTALIDRDKSPLKAASLTGGVVIDMKEAPNKGVSYKVHVTGNRLNYTRIPAGAKVLIQGQPRVAFEKGSEFGNFGGEEMTIYLNQKGELVQLTNGNN